MASEVKRLVILGSTGTIGRLALEVAAAEPELFEVVGLAAGRNVELLWRQVERFNPRLASVLDREAAADLRRRLNHERKTKVLCGPQGLVEVASMDEADLVVSAVVGFAGLAPTLAALKIGRSVALANKESLVAAGELVMAEAQKAAARVLPVDSEHAAIFQALLGHRRQDVARVILTASGGPFWATPQSEAAQVTPAQALAHPNWEMGHKVTVDSATLMNKGLEAIEARWLFDLRPEQIAIHIHPQSIVHSAVEFVDGSVLAQLSVPDMRLPIAYALGFPKRLPLKDVARLDLFSVGRLTFEPPDMERFPCLRLALEAGRLGRGAPAALTAADEVAVAAFLEERLSFAHIPQVVEETLERHHPESINNLEAVLAVDASARRAASQIVDSLAGKGA